MTACISHSVTACISHSVNQSRPQTKLEVVGLANKDTKCAVLAGDIESLYCVTWSSLGDYKSPTLLTLQLTSSASERTSASQGRITDFWKGAHLLYIFFVASGKIIWRPARVPCTCLYWNRADNHCWCFPLDPVTVRLLLYSTNLTLPPNPNPTLPYPTIFVSALPYPILLYSTLLYPTISCPSQLYFIWPYPTLLVSTLLYPTLSYPSLLYFIWPYPTPPYPTLHYSILSWSTLLYCILPYSTLSFPGLLYSALPYPTLPYSILHYPILFWSTLLYSTLFCPTRPDPTLSHSIQLYQFPFLFLVLLSQPTQQ